MKIFAVVVALTCLHLTAVFAADSADAADAGDANGGFSVADQSRWMDAQMRYGQAVKRHGADSQEAVEAQVMMNTLARDLGIKASSEVPQSAPSIPQPDPAPVSDDDTVTIESTATTQAPPDPAKPSTPSN
jgi:hypothetical protein